ncbi:hypothetical protein JHK84_043873 [Glycine max]|nr:hypothetical protein JHK84_043873 [Glycine max]
MLDLIAFALLILACSYWKLSGQLLNEENTERDLENVVSGEKQGDFANKESIKVYKEKILVIMAGDDPNVYTLHHQPQPLLRLRWPHIHHVAGLLHLVMAKEATRSTTVMWWSHDSGMAEGKGKRENVVASWLGFVSV